ncbi:DUF1868 domain-containing protein [Granulicella sp. 5B5]|uniref:DUF1868 domain-containing protein n=1 Tax=Granulicella sp. 5B5 TaxID=1617967 RepID=UPI0015F60C01|nr:DUF1868 domain-containing protein [Granulicella sp. 5B5]QMV18308.1 DUF1868 domain-containing protein [Granulicella sp. 5B5]
MSIVNTRSSRRAFLLQASALTAAAALPGALVAQSNPALDAPIDIEAIEQQAAKIPNRDTLLKFNTNGTRKPFAGNTVICHLPVQCTMRDAMVSLHQELAASPFRHKLGLTSTDSYHMTVFPGANDQDRTAYGWPSYVPLNATIEQCNQTVEERMQAARLRCKLPLRVRVDEPATLNYFAACTLRMVPADREENTKLRALRDQLAEVYGFRTKDHDQYTFHITMSYQTARFTAQEQMAYRKILRAHLQHITAAAPVLELGEPEYCIFPDMFRFEPKILLACS